MRERACGGDSTMRVAKRVAQERSEKDGIPWRFEWAMPGERCRDCKRRLRAHHEACIQWQTTTNPNEMLCYETLCIPCAQKS